MRWSRTSCRDPAAIRRKRANVVGELPGNEIFELPSDHARSSSTNRARRFWSVNKGKSLKTWRKNREPGTRWVLGTRRTFGTRTLGTRTLGTRTLGTRTFGTRTFGTPGTRGTLGTLIL